MKKILSITMVLVISVVMFLDKGVIVKANEKIINNNNNKEQILKSLNEIPEIALEKYPDIKNFILKGKEYLNKNKNIDGYERYMKSLPEYTELSKKYADESKNNDNKDYTEQEAIINKKAKEIYQEYKKSGVTKEDLLNNTNLPKLRQKRSATPADVVGVLDELGYSISQLKASEICAALGSLMALDGPLPFGDLIALVTGGFIISALVINAVINYKSEVVSYVGNSIGYNARLSAERAIENCEVYQNNKNNKYFEVTLFNQAGGGLSFVAPITYSQAIAILKQYSPYANTFTKLSADAKVVADVASNLTAAQQHGPHYFNKKNGFMPNNLPHWHPTSMFIKQDSHSFYAI